MCRCYVLLFACCVTQAVHLELTTDVNSNSVILALRIFISRRGTPRLLIAIILKPLNQLMLKDFVIPKESFGNLY